jgi:hypothetical protein
MGKAERRERLRMYALQIIGHVVAECMRANEEAGTVWAAEDDDGMNAADVAWGVAGWMILCEPTDAELDKQIGIAK